MKKIVALTTLILMAVLSMVGCAGDNVKTYSDAGETIEVKVDGEFIIALESNPSTGYTWGATYDGTKLELLEDIYVADGTDEMVVGAGGTQQFRFKALQSGQVTITMDYQRSWETTSIDQKVFTVDID